MPPSLPCRPPVVLRPMLLNRRLWPRKSKRTVQHHQQRASCTAPTGPRLVSRIESKNVCAWHKMVLLQGTRAREPRSIKHALERVPHEAKATRASARRNHFRTRVDKTTLSMNPAAASKALRSIQHILCPLRSAFKQRFTELLA